METQVIETMLAGLREYRPDLHYPASHSDMQACVRGLMRMFEIQRRPIARPLRIRCHVCKGTGDLIDISSTTTYSKIERCKECGGKGWLEG